MMCTDRPLECTVSRCERTMSSAELQTHNQNLVHLLPIQSTTTLHATYRKAVPLCVEPTVKRKPSLGAETTTAVYPLGTDFLKNAVGTTFFTLLCSTCTPPSLPNNDRSGLDEILPEILPERQPNLSGTALSKAVEIQQYINMYRSGRFENRGIFLGYVYVIHGGRRT